MSNRRRLLFSAIGEVAPLTPPYFGSSGKVNERPSREFWASHDRTKDLRKRAPGFSGELRPNRPRVNAVHRDSGRFQAPGMFISEQNVPHVLRTVGVELAVVFLSVDIFQE